MTTRTSSRARYLAAGLVAGLGFAAPVYAALGDPAAPVAGASTRTLAGGTADVISYVDAGGTTIDEYVATANGEIFGYAWQGPTMPNLQALLGRYAASYQTGAAELLAAQRGDLHAARVVRPDVVVETGGQMRSYVGRMWLPAALPDDVTEGDLR
jgi:hypothetical protein